MTCDAGVGPDVDVSAESAFDTAYGLALEHVLTLGRDGGRRAVAEDAEAARDRLGAVRR